MSTYLFEYILDSKEQKCENVDNLKRNVCFDFWNPKIHEYIKTLYIYYLLAILKHFKTNCSTNSGNKLRIIAIKTCVFMFLC